MQDFDRYVADRYDDQVTWHDRKAVLNKRLYLSFQTAIVVLAVVTSVTTALDLQNFVAPWWAIPVGASALVSIMTALQKVFQFQELWIGYRTTAESLRKERYLHLVRTGEYGFSDSPDRLFVERVENILSRQTSGWASQQSKTTNRKGEN